MGGNEKSSLEIPVEPLTRREREILALLQEGLTGQEIAERLTLATSTVRWYTQQIYGKLGVNSKRQAITRARQLGLPTVDTIVPVAWLGGAARSLQDGATD